MSDPYRVSQNSRYPRCIDGRMAAAFVEWQSACWTVIRDNARQENGPQYLGASLVFVRALEELARVNREQAFYLTEEASKRAHQGLQIHLDDAHGHYDFASMSDDDLVRVVTGHHTGCGFARYAWGDDAEAVIAEAKRRHWRIQLLVGDHAEHGAVINYRPGETFDTGSAVQAGVSQFNTDVVMSRRVFEILEDLTLRRGFAEQAETWMLATYKDVVVALNGVSSPAEIAELR